MASKSRIRPHGRKGRRPRRRIRVGWLIGATVVIASVAAGGLVISQSGGSTGGDSAVDAEANDDPGLPGIYVNLPDIYGGPYPDTGGHVAVDIDYEADGNSNPPVGGPHWNGDCGRNPGGAPPFCGPAPWGIFQDSWNAETLVHNMEHAGVVVWYNTSDDSVVAELEALVVSHLEDGMLLVMVPYPDMEEEHIAVTAWTRIDKFPLEEYDVERVAEFINQHERRFNPEGF